MKQSERNRQEQKIDEALEATFPASDTPSFVGVGVRSDKKPAERQPDASERPAGKRAS